MSLPSLHKASYELFSLQLLPEIQAAVSIGIIEDSFAKLQLIHYLERSRRCEHLHQEQSGDQDVALSWFLAVSEVKRG